MTDQVCGQRWDIFCRVVDNLGDIGVCWRLARDLTERYRVSVRLWVDEIQALQRICPQVQTLPARAGGVDIRRWGQDFTGIEVADCVIEAFACELPPAYLAAMAERQPAPLWINLEYLTAESWVDGCHGLASPHPVLPLVKHFFFPGFTENTGGLLREREILRQRQSFRSDPCHRIMFLSSLGASVPVGETLIVSLFAYTQPYLPVLLQSWSQMCRPVLLLVPEGPILPDIAAFFGKRALQAGDVINRQALTVVIVPFMPQSDYDRLLWCCDINFVRGEDSFVRAQWAGAPFVWQIYVQQDEVHLIKLRAFLELFCADLEEGAARALEHFWLSWNSAAEDDLAERWADYLSFLPVLKKHGNAWTEKLSVNDDLTTNLVKFSISGLK